jgi:hypothetical protein
MGVARAFDAERLWTPELTVWDGLVNVTDCGDAVGASA